MLYDEIRRQREEVQKKGRKAFSAWLFEYYAIPSLAVILIAGFVIWLLTSILFRKADACGIMFVNTDADVDIEESVVSGFAEYAGIDLRRNNVIFDYQIRIPKNGAAESQEEISAMTAVVVKTTGGELDGFAADAAVFGRYAEQDMFRDLREVFPEEELAGMGERIFYVDREMVDELLAMSAEEADERASLTEEEIAAWDDPETFPLPDPASMGEPVPVGIVITGLPKITEYGLYPDTAAVFGIPAAGPRPNAAAQFLRYLGE